MDVEKLLITINRQFELTFSDEEGRRRLDNPEDFVRLGIATALKRSCPSDPCTGRWCFNAVRFAQLHQILVIRSTERVH
jgi:hypothetical protein